MDTNLSKLGEIVEDRGAWCAVIINPFYLFDSNGKAVSH